MSFKVSGIMGISSIFKIEEKTKYILVVCKLATSSRKKDKVDYSRAKIFVPKTIEGRNLLETKLVRGQMFDLLLGLLEEDASGSYIYIAMSNFKPLKKAWWTDHEKS